MKCLGDVVGAAIKLSAGVERRRRMKTGVSFCGWGSGRKTDRGG